MNQLTTLCISLFICISLISCSQENEKQKMVYQAVNIESSDECHLCGMLIKNFDGPKGEIFRKEQGDTVFKFCSTRDMFSYYLDPENQRNVAQLLVHDMSKMPWGILDDKHFIDAKTAWYVSGSEKTGAMGKTLASFRLKEDAEAFAKEFSGEVLNFEQITLSVLM